MHKRETFHQKQYSSNAHNILGKILYNLALLKYQPNLLDYWKARTGKEPRCVVTVEYPGDTLTNNPDGKILDVKGYCKILGKLMWFCNKTMPEYGNAVRELASHMDTPLEVHWREMKRLTGYAADNNPATLTPWKPRDLKGLQLR